MADQNGVPRRKPVPSRQPPAELTEHWASDLTSQFRRTLSTKRMNELSSRPSSLRRSSRFPREIVVQSPQPQEPQSSQPPSSLDAAAQSSSPAPSLPLRPAPSSSSLPHVDGASLETLSIRSKSPPPSYSSLKNIPTVPVAPTGQKSLRFRNMLFSLSNTPCKWENPGLLDEALRVIPLQRIYEEAQDEADLLTAEAASLASIGEARTRPAWGYQDCVIRALMRWFKKDFFEWVNNPRCSTCHARTIGTGMVAPLPDESARGANRVELYTCSNPRCMSFERFPRYTDAFVLLQSRQGRVGEWANCFTMLCRAIGSRVRWVWNSEDHVWTEVWSAHRKRWVHVDCCEGAWDAPLLYTQGWKRKLAYCIAFSAEGCQDVTRRYVRSPAYHAAPRNKCSEGELMHILAEIRATRRRDMEKKEKFRLNAEDMKEDAELRTFIIEALAYHVSCILPGGDGEKSASGPAGGSEEDAASTTPAAVAAAAANAADPDAQKAQESRQDAATRQARRRNEHAPGRDQTQR